MAYPIINKLKLIVKGYSMNKKEMIMIACGLGLIAIGIGISVYNLRNFNSNQSNVRKFDERLIKDSSIKVVAPPSIVGIDISSNQQQPSLNCNNPQSLIIQKLDLSDKEYSIPFFYSNQALAHKVINKCIKLEESNFELSSTEIANCNAAFYATLRTRQQ